MGMLYFLKDAYMWMWERCAWALFYFFKYHSQNHSYAEKPAERLAWTLYERKVDSNLRIETYDTKPFH